MLSSPQHSFSLSVSLSHTSNLYLSTYCGCVTVFSLIPMSPSSLRVLMERRLHSRFSNKIHIVFNKLKLFSA